MGVYKKMFKVIIIDDEPIIVEGITRMVPWERFDCQIIATAEDGVEGSRLIRELKPDIIFSDIAMPGRSGLEMIAGLKSEFPELQICILTGYRDFDYAQQAIRLGVAMFLLKPSNMDEIEEALKIMTDRLRVNQKNGMGMDSEDSKNLQQEQKEESGPTDALEEDSVASSFIVKNAIKYIESNYTQKLTLSEVAEKTYVSQWHLSKLLNKHTGKNFSELLNNARIQRAMVLLKDPALRIGDIAEEVGFIDMAHFSRVFKKTMGVSANEYRNKIRKEEIE